MRRAILVLVAALLAGCTFVATPAPDPPAATPTAPAPTNPPPLASPPSRAPPSPAPAHEAPPVPPEGPPPTPGAPTPEQEEPPVVWPTPPRDRPDREPPLSFALGPDASGTYASARLVGDAFEVRVVGVGDATVRADALVLATNEAAGPRELALAMPRLDDPRVAAATLLVGSDAMDLLAATPEGVWVLAAGETVPLGVELTMGTVDEAEDLGERTLTLQLRRA